MIAARVTMTRRAPPCAMLATPEQYVLQTLVEALRAHALNLEADGEFELAGRRVKLRELARAKAKKASALAAALEKDGLAAIRPDPVKALRALRRESRDWQDVLGKGERPTLDKALAAADAAIKASRPLGRAR